MGNNDPGKQKNIFETMKNCIVTINDIREKHAASDTHIAYDTRTQNHTRQHKHKTTQRTTENKENGMGRPNTEITSSYV